MNPYTKIRAALQMMLGFGTNSEQWLTAGNALAALAELERAAAQPVAWMWNDELGIPHASAGSKKPVWITSSASDEYAKQANLRPLYTTPPPAPGMPKWYGMDTPWPLHDVLSKLIDATGVLLDRHSYDDHGHEGVRYAQLAGKEILANIFKERTK